MRLRFVVAAGAALVALFLSAGRSPASLASLGAARDNTLYSSMTGGRSNGAGSYFFAGVTAQGGTRRGLVAFDVSSIPAGSTVHSATLTLHMSRTIALPEEVRLHRMLAEWGEGASNANNEEGTGAAAQPGDATWLHRSYNTQLWAAAGGDFDATASASTLVGDEGFYSWTSFQTVSDVQMWVDGTAGSFGWMLMCNESGPITAKRFDTKENPTVEFRPVLTVDFTPVPEPSSVIAATATALAIGFRRARERVAV